MSSAARDLFGKGIREKEKDMSAVLENTLQDSINTELKRKISDTVALNWEAPDGLKFAKDDFLSEIFVFA